MTALPDDLIDPGLRATQEQARASDPAVSAFVAASAGSGKTKVLTDRILRLMLGGTAPGRIQCLTFTKAAAAEMALRLQHRLGHWVTLDDAALDEQLNALRVGGTEAHRQLARSLFAQVLDLPGGMRISTIHAFCQSLLRRFPLEAAISPNFRLVESLDQATTLDRAREGVIVQTDPAALAGLAALATIGDIGKLVLALQAFLTRVEPLMALAEPRLAAAVRRQLDVQYADEAALMAVAVAVPDEAALAEAMRQVAAYGSDAGQRHVAPLLRWLSMPPVRRIEHWADWAGGLLRADGAPYDPARFVTVAFAKRFPAVKSLIATEQARVCEMDDQRRSQLGAEATIAMLGVTLPVLRAYAAAKDYAGQLDYGDLIARTSALLVDPGAAWVLYKLDGGIDHLLLDEVQDTAPAQWQIAHRLTHEFFAGLGTRDDGPPRTFFAVGDPKQSIYSFQGAEPDEFSRSRAEMAARVGPDHWRDVALDVSFRSAAPVLALVDAVFAQPLAVPGVAEDGPLRHYTNRVGAAGRVELWPLVPYVKPDEAGAWEAADRNRGTVSGMARLADAIGAWIAGQLAAGARLDSQDRPMHAGDVLVLVRRRIEFDRALVRALKSAGVPVAGLDRMVLTQQPAVQDLLALCRALLLPQDDLSLAEMLTSPLGNLSDDSLMELAADRRATLYESLRTRAAERPEWQLAETFFTTLLSRVDYAAPHDLLSEALGPLGARARLFARLGPQAAEPVDELLSAALLYAGSHPASLQGFLHWLELSAAEVKREGETEGDTVRIMTVHGSKGLEASLVILPDTTLLPPAEQGIAWTVDKSTGAELPLWQPNAHFACQAVQTLRAKAEAARLCEHNRLLYVALTRARDRLLICGWEPHRQQPGTWYEQTRAALAGVGAEEVAFGPWPGTALRLETAQTAPSDKKARGQSAQAVAVPDWAGNAPHWRPHPLPPEPRLPTPLAPSRPEGVELGPVPPARSPLASTGQRGRFNRGLVMHTLLQHLPDIAVEDREAAAHAYTSRPSHALDDPEAVAEEALAVLAAPDLAGLFSPAGRAEQPISGLVAGRIVSGQVDRLAVLPDRVLIADYKTNRAPPARAEDVPVLYLRQMATYRGVLAALYPDRPVTCLLIWTDGPAVMPLPAALLDKHAPA